MHSSEMAVPVYHSRDWRDGEIAFLIPAEHFYDEDYHALIDTRQVVRKATGHPVIVLKRLPNGNCVVTTVSAYSNSRGTAIPPWQQWVHRTESPRHFRAFVGSARPNTQHDFLRLQGDRIMPKVSWVHINRVFEVTATTLVTFNKTRGILRLAEESLRM